MRPYPRRSAQPEFGLTWTLACFSDAFFDQSQQPLLRIGLCGARAELIRQRKLYARKNPTTIRMMPPDTELLRFALSEFLPVVRLKKGLHRQSPAKESRPADSTMAFP